MWHHVLQAFLIFTASVIALGIRYALVDRQAGLPPPHRIYLLQPTYVKKLRHHALQGTWLAVLFVAVSTLTLCENAPRASFYPYGRFAVQQAKIQVSPTPTAAIVHHQAYGRFGIVTPEPQTH